MSRLTESAIEYFPIKLFERLGYDYIHARMATNYSQLKMTVTNGRGGQLSGIAGQLPQTASNSLNCPIIPDSSKPIKNGMVAISIV